jgi:hypothetical protein
MSSTKITKFYSIIVGGEPAKVEVGFLGDDGRPKPGSLVGYIETAGIAVQNYARVWGKRQIDPKTKEPNGTIDFLPWDDEKGELIEIRFLKTSSSLDMEYQKKKGVRVSDKDAEILLSVGINNFDVVTDKARIEMIKHHYQNGDNISREPGIPVVYYEYDSTKATKADTEDRRLRQQAENIVMDANDDNVQSLEILASLFHDIEPRQQQDVLYTELLERADRYGFFLDVLAHHRSEFRNLVEKAIEVELIDVSSNDIYIVKNGHKDILLQSIEAARWTKLPTY